MAVQLSNKEQIEVLEEEKEIIDYDLWESARDGNVDKVKQLLQNGANLNCRNREYIVFGLLPPPITPHTISYIKGHDIIVDVLENAGATPDYNEIMLAAADKGLVDIVKETIQKKANVNYQDKDGDHKTALHYASRNRHIETVKLLLTAKADPNICDKDHQTALHFASWAGHIEIVKLFLSAKADSNICDKDGCTPAHYAAMKGHTDTVKLLIEIGQADICTKDNDGCTPAHYAAMKGHTDTVKLLIEIGQADICTKDNDGNSLLHSACLCGGLSSLPRSTSPTGSKDTIQYLLNDVKLNPLAVNNRQQIPLQLISPNLKDRFQLLKLFQPFLQHNIEYPVQSYAKIFICGKRNAGKSSLAAVISYRADRGQYHYYNAEECVKGVVLQTTGIDYHSICSWEIGNVVIFDLAGHAEYYSSHAAVLETLLLRSPAVFVVVSNLDDDKETIKKDLYFWFNFVESVSTNLNTSSQLIIVGSHIDLVPDVMNFQSIVDGVANDGNRFQNYKGYLAMECHRPGGKGVKEFMVKLRESCEAAVDRNDKMSYYCHCVNAFLQNLEVVAISLDDLCSLLKERNEPYPLSDRSCLKEFLTILGEKGLILYLGDWLIVDKKALLTLVNGVLFNKSITHVQKPVASNTGIMPLSTLATLFPDYNIDMLVRFLTSLQFCHQMDAHAVSTITNNITPEESSIEKDDKFLFFPSLIDEKRPPSVLTMKHGLGWCLWCPNPHQFLSTRFLHVLLLHIAYKYCLPQNRAGYVNTSQEVPELQRDCTMWKNGILWKDENNTKMMVEVSEDNRCVTILVSDNESIQTCQVRTSLIKDVLNLKNELCPCKAQQFAIPCGNAKDVIDMEVRHRTLFALGEIARGVMLRGHVRDTNRLLDEALDVKAIISENEPYLCIDPQVTIALFDDSKRDLQLSDSSIEHIQEIFGHTFSLPTDLTHHSIREHLNKFSVFAGRNPLKIATPCIREEEIILLPKNVHLLTKKGNQESKPCTSIDDFSPFPKLSVKPTRREVLIQLACIDASWRELGYGFGVSYNNLRGLAQSYHGNLTKLSEVIQIWIEMDGKDDGAPVTWNTILDVLKGPLINNKALAMKIYQLLKEESSKELIAPKPAKESGTTNTTEGYNTDKLPIQHQRQPSKELSNEPKEETIPSDSTQQGTCDPSEIFLDYFADICDAIEVKPISIVNHLLTARLISSTFKEDVQSMSGDNYDKADKVVNELQRQVQEKGIKFLKTICHFFLKQNHELKDIGTRMRSQLESLAPPT